MNILHLQRDVLQNKRIFIFGKVGQGKSRMGNTFSGELPFTRADEICGVTRDIETFLKPEFRLTIIDSPGVLDTEDGLLFHRAFIESIKSHQFERNFLNRLKIDDQIKSNRCLVHGV